jgi:hypothetical protein
VVEIYCPRCAWHPQSNSLWLCAPSGGGCGHVWNTFDTRGICPNCQWQWHVTACLSCHRYSAHVSWYHDPKPPQGRGRHVHPDEDVTAGTNRRG